MRLAVITDLHANLPALRAALHAIRALGVDGIVHTGDAIGIGPYPAECLDALLALPDARLLMGNHDAWFAHGLAERPPWMAQDEFEHHQWAHAQLDPSLRAVVARWPYELVEREGDAFARLLHYPRNAAGDFRSPVTLASAAEADALFEPAGERVVCYGHHHPPSDIAGRARYVNPGALGCGPDAVARFALLELGRSEASVRVTLHAAPYDAAPVHAEMARRRVPARDFIARVFLPRAT